MKRAVGRLLVCRKFETERRRSLLSFEHHKTVGALKPEIAESLLSYPRKEGIE
jgi:hypothetical protein